MTQLGPVDLTDACERLPFWPHLSPQERERVMGRMTMLHYQAGQTVRGGNSDCLGLVIVMRGVLRAYLLSPNGREITLYRMKGGDSCVLAASCVLDAISFDTLVDAEEDSDILLLPVDVYAALMKNNLYVERDTYKMATERFSDVVAGLERLAFMNLEQRLISFLLDETADNGSNTIRMTHEQIAVNIGSAREVVSRSLKSLAVRGWVELFRGGVRLKDKETLYQLIQ
ncbi:MAG: Crp/Fnr family transcriptional regulator [Oscillospiraceae bacterium]|jgi:CRP/FNR family transcriptional regulator